MPVAYLSDIGTPSGIFNLKKNRSFIKSFDYNYGSAAELINEHYNVSAKDDIFSIGLIVLFCMDPQRFMEFRGNERMAIKYEILEEYLRQMAQAFPPRFYQILRRMLSFSSLLRPSVKQLFKEISKFSIKTT